MKNVYIPTINENNVQYFEVQIYYDYSDDNLIISGYVDSEIEQSVYISLTILKSWKIKIPNFIHIHFPDYNYLKAGISASLGIFFQYIAQF